MRILKKELWPYRVTVSVPPDNRIEKWIDENMGPHKGRWNVVWHNKNLDYYFRTQGDAVLFGLKWQ